MYAHVLVDINIAKGFCDEIYFENELGDLTSQRVKYDWKPVWCDKCSQLGHLGEACKSVAEPPCSNPPLVDQDGFQRVQRAKGKVPSQAPAAPSTALTRHTDLVASRNNFDVLDDIPKEHSEVPLVVSFGTINNAGDLPHQSNG